MRLESIVAMFSGAWERIREFAVSMWDRLKHGVLSKLDALGSFMREKMEDVLSFFRELPGKALQWGIDMIQGLIDGILSMPGKLMDAISDVVGGAVDWAKGLLGIESPSKVFQAFGREVGAGLALGIESGVGGVQRALDTLIPQPSVTVNGGMMPEVAPSLTLSLNVDLGGAVARVVRTLNADELRDGEIELALEGS